MSKEQVNTEETVQQEAPKTYLLSTISYTDKADYNKFLENLSPEHALIVLISAANHGQLKGAYNLDEAELIAKAIRTITPNSAQEETPAEEAAPKKARASAKNPK
jgi:septum formation inhibitor MinC